ncbi:RPA-interacting protein [Hondaea fermentalgiana]|uniref:RPA-interacting protein n=1 Tax=Hondaea fermentalgiana TaxID=2315210 RepID=A0A2R5GE99_9STRA|nr:RPA-interacting protein [Hondaea fermentalgiana]|eukprot:GBG26551.1 RPA-interacting protein [Hondaea fermentalgiana]
MPLFEQAIVGDIVGAGVVGTCVDDGEGVSGVIGVTGASVIGALAGADEIGARVGAPVVGACDVGSSVGTCVGADVGDAVGARVVGSRVGCAVGMGVVGDGVGQLKSTMQRAGGGGGGGGGGTGWTSTAMANAWGANSGQIASGKDSPWSGAHAGAMTPAGSTATAARDSRRERLAQRCKDRLKSARRDRLRTHRIRTLAEQVIREEIGALEEPLCEEDLLRLEKEVLAELYADEERALRELEAEDRARARELEHYARQEEAMSSTHEQQQRSIQTASSAQLLCPVCMRAHLHLRGTVFHCDCGFRLDAKNECVSLEQLRQRLAHAMESHAMQAPPCGHQPQFSLKRHLAGIELLVMECQGCACFHVVL